MARRFNFSTTTALVRPWEKLCRTTPASTGRLRVSVLAGATVSVFSPEFFVSFIRPVSRGKAPVLSKISEPEVAAGSLFQSVFLPCGGAFFHDRGVRSAVKFFQSGVLNASRNVTLRADKRLALPLRLRQSARPVAGEPTASRQKRFTGRSFSERSMYHICPAQCQIQLA